MTGLTHILWVLFGPGAWGTGGNIVAWVLCGTVGFGWLHAKEKARHLQKIAQAARHHADLLQQQAAQHQKLTDLAVKHHQELLDRADVRHEALKAHITAQAPAVIIADRVPADPVGVDIERIADMAAPGSSPAPARKPRRPRATEKKT